MLDDILSEDMLADIESARMETVIASIETEDPSLSTETVAFRFWTITPANAPAVPVIDKEPDASKAAAAKADPDKDMDADIGPDLPETIEDPDMAIVPEAMATALDAAAPETDKDPAAAIDAAAKTLTPVIDTNPEAVEPGPVADAVPLMTSTPAATARATAIATADISRKPAAATTTLAAPVPDSTSDPVAVTGAAAETLPASAIEPDALAPGPTAVPLIASENRGIGPGSCRSRYA